MTNPKKNVVAALNDLMFIVKIQEAAKRAGLDVTFVKSSADAIAQAKLGPAVLILDLNSAAFDALHLISALKSDPETSAIDLIGYVSHVQVELKQAAQDKGCNQVLARSAFVQNLPALLQRYAPLSDP